MTNLTLLFSEEKLSIKSVGIKMHFTTIQTIRLTERMVLGNQRLEIPVAGLDKNRLIIKRQITVLSSLRNSVIKRFKRKGIKQVTLSRMERISIN